MKTDIKELLDKMLDADDTAPVEIVNDRDEKARFSQVALVPVTVDSEEYEGEKTEHYFAFLQPIDEDDQKTGDTVIFDISVGHGEKYTIDVVTDPYLINELYSEYQKMRKNDDGEEDEALAELDEEIAEDIKEAEKPKKRSGFFGRLFGKKD